MSPILRNIRPEFLTRISNIIVVQVVFAFAAIALVVFFPEHGPEAEADYTSLKNKLSLLGANLAAVAGRNSTDPLNSHDVSMFQSEIDGAFRSEPSLIHLEWYLADDQGRFTNILNFDRLDHEDKVYGRVAGVSQPMSQSEIAHLIHTGPLNPSYSGDSSLLIPVLMTSGTTACFHQSPLTGGTSAALVAVYDHDLFVATRSSLKYGLLLVFLTSTLISLLTAYLLIKKYRDPLRQLIQGFEKTSQGELYHFMEADDGGEFRSLSRAFNKMAEKLCLSHQQMKEFNLRLQNANQTLERSRSFLRTMIDSSPNSVIAVSGEGKITLCNRKVAEDTGYDTEQLMGSNVDDLFTRPVYGRFTDRNIDDSERFEAICVRKDSTQFPAYLIATPISDDTGSSRGFLLMMKDISESRSYQDMMIRIDRFCTRGEMAGDIAHEINNYLTILSGNIELMPLLLKKNNMERIDSKLHLMRDTIDKIARFCDGLMDANQGDAHFEAADLNQLIQNVVAFLQPQNKFDFVDVQFELANDLPPVEFDIGQIQQVLVNIIYNAAEALAGREGERVIRITTRLESSLDVPGARVIVRDSGPGVVGDRVGLLFKKRFTTKPRGHGIGLITCKKILDTHGGAISYTFDNGAVFRFEIPLVQPSGPKADAEEPSRDQVAISQV